MAAWFQHAIVDTGRLPLFCFFAGMIVGFGFIRFSVRMIRAQVKWWPGNIESSGGVHLHHMTFGVVLMLVGGVVGFAIPGDLTAWRSVAAAVFGVGSALVLDEFALILHLEDVYWTRDGRVSIDAIFVAVCVTGLLLLGLRPAGVSDLITAYRQGGTAFWAVGVPTAILSLSIAAVTLLKGKIWTGLIGLFIPILLIVGAIRLARPHSPWARWRYAKPGHRRAEKKLARAEWREQRIRAPMMRAKVRFQELIAGNMDGPPPPE